MRKCLRERLAVVSHYPAHRQQSLVTLVQTQEGLEQVALGPEHPESRIGEINLIILEWHRDVVKVHDNTWLQTGQDVEDHEVHVAADPDCVATVDEQDVVLL